LKVLSHSIRNDSPGKQFRIEKSGYRYGIINTIKPDYPSGGIANLKPFALYLSKLVLLFAKLTPNGLGLMNNLCLNSNALV